MLNIDNNVYYPHSINKLGFKSSPNVTKPNVEINNIGHSSLQSLASYNVAQLELDKKTKNNVIKPFNVPNNIDDIKGEKIFNSNGKLIEIHDEDENYKTIYRFNDTISYNMIKTDKTSNIIYQQVLDGEMLYMDKKLPNGKIFSTVYENNIPVQIDEYFYTKDNDQTITYLPKEGEYSINQHFNSENGKAYRFLDFDKNGKCKSAFEGADGQGRSTEIKLIDGVPYSIHKSTDEVIKNNIKFDDIDLTNLHPEPYYDIDYNKILNTDGKKEYYSNGKIEKIIANDGNIYNFNLSGELTDVKNKDYSIQITTKEDTICDNFEPDHQRIEKVSENGGKIITQYFHDKDTLVADVFYENLNTKENKHAVYKEGKLISYDDFNNNISFDYDENGNLCNFIKEE